MTSYPDAVAGYPAAVQNAGPVRRPGTLVAAVVVAVLSALASVVDGVLYLAGGRDLARDLAAKAIASVLGGSADSVKESGNSLLDASVAEVQSTLQARAGVALAFGALLLFIGLAMLGGAVWSRVLGTLAALLNAGIALRIATDVEGGTSAICGVAWLAAVTALVVIVLMWLPANNRYAKARKAARR
ncbi:MAG TPA: hypothetical protein VJX66_16535 [Amycolatopsis sp.]|nr:hypothetical protein [Amycolatopsis sp.]